MIEPDKLNQIKDILRLMGQDDSQINEAMNLTKPEDFLSLLYKVRGSLDKAIKLFEEHQRKNESSV